jgi:acetyl-CoA carboxylase biotin carboxyl carrier protein
MATAGKAKDGDLPEKDGSSSLTPEAAVQAVGTLIEMMAAGGVKKLDLSFGDIAIRLRSHDRRSSTLPAREPVIGEEDVAAPLPDGAETSTIDAPMIGTYYVAPSPQDPPFVNVGDHVETGQVIGIIEAMKIMNEIVADRSGRVVEIIAQNGEAVEYGSPLLRIATVAAVEP